MNKGRPSPTWSLRRPTRSTGRYNNDVDVGRAVATPPNNLGGRVRPSGGGAIVQPPPRLCVDSARPGDQSRRPSEPGRVGDGCGGGRSDSVFRACRVPTVVLPWGEKKEEEEEEEALEELEAPLMRLPPRRDGDP